MDALGLPAQFKQPDTAEPFAAPDRSHAGKNCAVFRVVLLAKVVLQLWAAGELKTVRRVTLHYYFSLCYYAFHSVYARKDTSYGPYAYTGSA